MLHSVCEGHPCREEQVKRGGGGGGGDSEVGDTGLDNQRQGGIFPAEGSQ